MKNPSIRRTHLPQPQPDEPLWQHTKGLLGVLYPTKPAHLAHRGVTAAPSRLTQPRTQGLRLQRQPLSAAAALLCGLAGAWPVSSWAQTSASGPAQSVEVVGVSPVPGLGVPVDRVPAHVQLVRARDLAASQSADVSDYLSRRLGSVNVNDIQGNPLMADISFRGFSASPLLGSQQGLSVYMDGVRLNQPFGDTVAWDLLPQRAVAQLALMPGSNPLFGLNTLGGALVLQSKDGFSAPGTEVQFTAGSHSAYALEAEHGWRGAGSAEGWHAYASARLWGEQGWRQDSNSEQGQLFAKLGQRGDNQRWSVSASLSNARLKGNGLQDIRLLNQDWSSVYTRPDLTRNEAALVNAQWQKTLSEHSSLSGNVYWRQANSRTLNADINEGSLDQATVQPSATEREALAAAGYSGFPTSGETAANTPFPKWRCIGQALLGDEPGEKCNGVINQTHTVQHAVGLNFQWNSEAPLFGLPAQSLLGLALERSQAHFTQGSELGYLTPDHGVVGVGAFGDGVTGGNADGAPYDTRVDLQGRNTTTSLFASSTLQVTPATHITAAARWNQHQVRNRDAILPGGGAGSLDGDARYARLNPSLGFTHAASAGLNVFGNISQGSRAPSAVELGCADPANPCKLPNAFAGDPPLRQVVTTHLELGLRGRQGGFSWSGALFRADNRDDLLFVADNAAGFGYFRNFGQTRRQGLEVNGQWTASRSLTLGGAFTWLDATFRSAETLGGSANSSNDEALGGFPGVEGTIDIHPGDRIPLLPRQQLKLFAQWQAGTAWQWGLDVTAMGSSLARGNENSRHQPDGVYYLGSGRNPAYALANLSVTHKPAPGVEVFGLVRNLFDRRYTTAAQLGATGFNEAGGYQSRPFAANANGNRPVRSSTFVTPGAPRSVQVGVRWRF